MADHSGQNSRLVLLTFGTFGQLLLQTVLQIVCAKIYGTDLQMDASTAALIIPLALTGLIAMPLSAVLIPQLQQLTREQGGDQKARESASWLMLVVMGCGMGMAFVLQQSSGVLVDWVYPDLEKQSAEETARQLSLLVWMFPANLLIGLTQNMAHWKSQFLFPVIGGLLGPLLTVVVTMALGASWGIDALNWGLVWGAWAGALVQFLGIVALLSVPKGNAVWIRNLLWLALPVLLGNLALRLEPLIDRSFSSGLEQGTLSQLGYASRIVLALCSLSAGGISTLIFPQLSATAHDRDQLRAVYSRGMETLVYLLMPVVVAVACFHRQIVADLLQRGAFTSQDTAVVSMLLVGSLGVVIGSGLGEISARTFFALNSTRWPVLISTPLLLGGFVLKALLVDDYGVVSLVIISSVVYLLSAIVQMSVLWWRFGLSFSVGILQPVLMSLLASLPSVAAGYGLIHFGVPYPAVWGGVVGVISYAAIVYGMSQLQRRDAKTQAD